MKHLALLVLGWVLSSIPLIRADYSIDDRDSRIRYFGSRAWELHSDPSYMGTT